MGGVPSTRNRYNVGGAGRPEEWGAEIGSDAAASVWVGEGPNGDRVRQVAASQGAPSGGGGGGRKGRERVRIPRRARKSQV